MNFTPPPKDCAACPRLAEFRQANAATHPDYHNAPVPAFGPLEADLLVVGLAPGMHGANATGRPFTGDYAGEVLYPALLKCGLASGVYARRRDDGLTLRHCRITNAVRCLPPQNKPETAEIRNCNCYLKAEIAAMPKLKVVLTLGLVAHKAVLGALGYKQSSCAFGHGALHRLENGRILVNSYHTSRYNMNTGRLTEAMFDEVMARICRLLAE